jgi:hypothetical protein
MKCESDILSWLVIILVIGIVISSINFDGTREMLTYELREVTVTFPYVTSYSGDAAGASGPDLADGTSINYEVKVYTGNDLSSLDDTDLEATVNLTVTNSSGAFSVTGTPAVTDGVNSSGVNFDVNPTVDGDNVTFSLSNIAFADSYSTAITDLDVKVSVKASLSSDNTVASGVQVSSAMDLTEEHKGLGSLQPVTGVNIEITPMS